jgi:hypothetical protein
VTEESLVVVLRVRPLSEQEYEHGEERVIEVSV